MALSEVCPTSNVLHHVSFSRWEYQNMRTLYSDAHSSERCHNSQSVPHRAVSHSPLLGTLFKELPSTPASSLPSINTRWSHAPTQPIVALSGTLYEVTCHLLVHLGGRPSKYSVSKEA